MPKFKKINKSEAVRRHLTRYGSIDRQTAMSLYNAFDLPDIVRRIRNQSRASNGLKIEVVEGSSPNTKYRCTNT